MGKVHGRDVFTNTTVLLENSRTKLPVSRRTKDVVHIYALDVDENGLFFAPPCRKFLLAFFPF